MMKLILLSQRILILFGIFTLGSAFIFWENVSAAYVPASDIYIFGSGNSGQNGNIAFSYSPTLSWSAPINPTKLDNAYRMYGNVWIDSVGWTTFDHGVANSEVKIQDTSCIADVSRTACAFTGFLWSKNAGWIRFAGNNGAADVEFHRPSLTLSGIAWNNQIGWIDVSGIKLILGPLYPSFTGSTHLGGGDYALSTTGSTDLGLGIPASILPLLSSISPITMEICISGGTYCKIYTLNTSTGKFPGVDLSLAGNYTYTITDPFGSITTGMLRVYAGPVISNGSSPLSGTYNAGQGLFKKYCADNPGDTIKCPDTIPSTSFVTGELKNGEVVGPRYANNSDSYVANLRLRDAYGNPIESIVGVKNVNVTLGINSNLDFNSVPYIYQYGGLSAGVLGDAFSLDYFGNNIGIIAGLGFSDTKPYVPSGESIKIRSYAPTTAGNTTIPANNDILITNVSVQVNKIAPYTSIGEGTYTITSLLKTTPLPFLPLAQVTSIQGFSDIQVGRESLFTGSIVVNDAQNAIGLGSSYAIHSLTIGDGISLTTSTFQDFVSPGGDECHAFTNASGPSVPGYIGYCYRGSNILASPSSVITLPFSTSRNHVFSAFPRRIVQIDLEQGYLYDSLIRYTIDGKEIVYPSLKTQSIGSNDKVFGNAVKIIGQKSGNNIFQSFVNSDQMTISTQSRSEAINTIRKNIGILTRNVNFTGNIFTGSSLKVYKRDITLNPVQEIITDGKRTIVAYGDITITSDLINPNQSTPLAIIALKDESGSGGNIYITSNVKRLDITLVAQGTIFSGEKTGSVLYYAQEPNAIDLLKNQLYIYGAVSSQNTIGGSSLESGPKCPSLDIACNNSNALIYDFEHFRYFRGGASEAAPLAHGSLGLEGDDKNSSLIIEFNPELLKNPPPGINIEN